MRSGTFFSGVSALIILILFVWAGVFVFAHDWMFRMHSRWFKLSVETFDAD